MSEKRKKRKIGWLIVLLIIAALVGSYAVAMTNADMAETILKGWIIVGMIAMPIASIWGLTARRKMYKDTFRRIEEANKEKSGSISKETYKD